VDAAGNVYIPDSSNRRVRKVSPDGTITTVVGNGVEGNQGDGGLATFRRKNEMVGTMFTEVGVSG
jgi:hypothetical protein